MLCMYSGLSHLPAADSEKEPQDIGLLLLLKLFNVFEPAGHVSQAQLRSAMCSHIPHLVGMFMDDLEGRRGLTLPFWRWSSDIVVS